jgi:hypothetical protein
MVALRVSPAVSPLLAHSETRSDKHFYPIQLHIMCNHARTKAVIMWSAGWTGGTLSFQKADGHWLPPKRDGWIT